MAVPYARMGRDNKRCCEGWPDLSAHRESCGITLDEVAQATKISKSYLQAIEEGDIAQLPGGIYTVSFVRQYARAVRFDEEELLAHIRPHAVYQGSLRAPAGEAVQRRSPILGLYQR
jgi:transcriptional regulator with XRE-family HTH domain